MDGSLAGLVVVAVEQAVAAPFCTARLADAGARVIKIERPVGDNDLSRQCGKVPVIGEQTDHVLAEFCESVRAS